MSEANMIQQLYDQIDRLISMQNTMLTVAGIFFALVIGLFAFFQWRISKRDQDIIIKIAQEQLIESLISNYNLLDINENRKVLTRVIDKNERDFKENAEIIYELKMKSIESEYGLNRLSIALKRYLILEENILLNIQDRDYIDNKTRDQILEGIRDLRNSGGKNIELAKGMSDNLFRLLSMHSQESLDKSTFDIESISKNDKESG